MTTKVFLHGFFSGPLMWRPVQRQLVALGHSNPFVAPELPFHGGGSQRTFDGCCALLWRRLLADCADPIDLIGYSLGARLALKMACLRPRQVVRLTLIGVHPGLQDAAARRARAAQDALWQRRFATEPLQAVASLWDAQTMFAPRQAIDDEAQMVLRQSRIHLVGAKMARSLEVLGQGVMPPTQPLFDCLTMPVRLVVGAGDQKYVEIARQMGRDLPDAEAVVVPGALHDVVLTHPKQLAELIVAA